MIRRFAIVILAPIFFVFTIFQVLAYSIGWIITGKFKLNDCDLVIEWLFKEMK